ncbi:MAG: hypothetical protein ACRDD7_17775 [Peptostreptococcaceae bacterium]
MYFKPVTVLEVCGDMNRPVGQYRNGDVVEVHYLGLKKCIGKIHSVGMDSIELDISQQYSSSFIEILYANICDIFKYEEE